MNPMTPAEWGAQILGIIALCISYFIYTSKKRSTLITLKLICDVLWGLHYFLLGAWSGAILNVINMGRETVFQLKTSRQWARSRIWVAVFISVGIASTLFSWQGPESLLPAVGSSISVIGLWCNDPKYIRVFSFPGITLWFVYSIIQGTPIGILSNAVTLFSIGVGLYRDFRRQPNSKN